MQKDFLNKETAKFGCLILAICLAILFAASVRGWSTAYIIAVSVLMAFIAFSIGLFFEKKWAVYGCLFCLALTTAILAIQILEDITFAVRNRGFDTAEGGSPFLFAVGFIIEVVFIIPCAFLILSLMHMRKELAE